MSDELSAADADRALVVRAQAGDRTAFDALVVAYRPGVERLVRSYVKNAEEAEDVVQNAFLKAFQHLPSFRGEATFRTWIHRIAINAALDQRAGQPAASWLELEDDMAFTRTLGTTRLVAAELWRKVAERIATLPPKQRLVVELRLFHNLPFEEIATIADTTENAAKVSFHTAVKRLRELAPDR